MKKFKVHFWNIHFFCSVFAHPKNKGEERQTNLSAKGGVVHKVLLYPTLPHPG